MSPTSHERPRMPRMADVAARAGVSHQTVSRVLNGMPGVRPETHDRVMAAVDELRYRRNFAAKQLASTRSRTLGVVTWGNTQFGPANVLLALEAAARETEYRLATVNVVSMSSEAFRSAVDQLLERVVEALVVIVPHESVLREAQSLALDIPVVVVEGDLSETPLTAGVDNVQGARLATEHLLSLGHETVVHLSGADGLGRVARPARRVAGRAGAPGTAGAAVALGRRLERRSGYLTGRSLAREADVTAVFVANDQMALGLLRALREAGRRVPEDVSVVGFDDLPEARYFPRRSPRSGRTSGARPARDGHPLPGARRRGAPVGTWCRPRWWSATRPPRRPRRAEADTRKPGPTGTRREFSGHLLTACVAHTSSM